MPEQIEEQDKMTAEKIAEILKASMPVMVSELGTQLADQMKDQWEKSLEQVAKDQEQADRDARESANMPLDVQKAVAQGARAEQREKENAPDPMDTMAAIVRAMATTKSDQPLNILNAIKAEKGVENHVIESMEKAISLQEQTRSAMQASQFDNAGILIPEEVSSEMIPLLESLTFIRRRAGGAVPLTHGTLKVGKQNSRATATHQDEQDDYTPTSGKFGDLKLDAKKLTAASVQTREMAQFGGNVGAGIITRDLVTAIAQKEDVTLLRSNGTEYQPRGIRHWIRDENILNDPIDTFDNNIQNLLATLVRIIRIQLESDLPISTQNSTFAMAPTTWANLYRAHDPGSGIAVFKSEIESGRILGYEFDVTNNVPANLDVNGDVGTELYFIHWPSVLVGAVPGLRMEMSTTASYMENGVLKSAFSRDEMVFKAVQYYDMVFRYDFGAVMQALPADWKGDKAA